MSRQFHLGDILSVTTGHLVALRHMEAMYDILNYMTGDNLFTHQLPRACDECGPELLRQHPQLADVNATDITPDNWLDWLVEQVVRFGETLEVHPLGLNAHERKDPLTELREMMGPDKPIIVVTPDAEGSAE